MEKTTGEMMGVFKRAPVALIIAMGIGLHPGCATTKIWLSEPEKRQVTRAAYTVLFEPIKKDKAFFSIFRLSITNKTDATLEVDWNKTQYLFNGKPSGPFVFKGVDPAKIKALRIPPDSIPGRGHFTREIAPFRLIAWTPVRDDGRVTDGISLINAGAIPAGKNGIRLVVGMDGKKIPETMTVTISQKAER